MRIKKVIKRLIALGAGATMLGATVMGAMAADLSSYPDKFQTGGVFNGYVVVGENAKPIDNLAATDIATSMWYNKPKATATTTVSGDAWKVGTSTKKLEITTTNTTLTGEGIYDIENWIGKDELKALADGTYTTNAGNYAYTQYLYFDVRNNEQNEIVAYRENDADKTADFFYVKSGANIGQYKLEFSSIPESTIQDTAGSTATAGVKLDDFENTKINFLGKEYDIVLARRPQATPEDSIKLTLMGGATTGSILEGETKTFDLSGTSYEVSLVYTDTTYAKFTVNGESTAKLQVGDTYKLKSGKEIGVSEVLYQGYAGGVHSSKFFLGASKLELRDNTITDSAGSNTLVVGSNSISGADVIVTGTDDNTTFRLTGIIVNMTAQDDYFVPANGKLSDAIVGRDDDKELLFTNNWDIEYKGLDSSIETHEIRLYSSTDRKYKLQFYDGDNNQVQMPLFYAYNTTNLQFSEDSTDKEVILNEGVNVSKDDYFVLTQGDPSAGTAKTYVLQYKGADKSDATSPKIKFKNLGSGETLEYAIDTAAQQTVATIKLGGYSWGVQNISSKGTSDFNIEVDQNGDASYGTNQPIGIVDSYGLNITIGGYVQTCQPVFTAACNSSIVDSSIVDFSTRNTNDYDTQAPLSIDLTVDATTGNEVTFSTLQMGEATQNLLTPESEENIAYGYTTMGGKLTYKTPSSSPAELVYAYPKTQVLPQVYVTSGAVTSTVSSGDLALVQVVDATKLDTEVADKDAQNLIVVGGPCVNSVAAALLGNPKDCAEGFSAGKARIKMFDTGTGKIAMLVAGYSGEDTRLAGKVIAHRYKEMKGSEMEVAGTTYSSATLGAPTVVTTVAAAPAAATTPATTQ